MVLLLQYTIIFASVLCLVALGGCFSEHSGVINLGLEGIMVMGALGGAVTMKFMGPSTPAIVIILMTTLVAVCIGMLYSVLLAVASINFNADQTLIGTAMNLLATAAATVFVRALNTAENPDNVSTSIQYIQQKKAFLNYFDGFEFNWFMLMALVCLILSYIILYKTRFGLRLQACGENPHAADSVGINVYKMRWAGVLISGLLGGLGGIVYITAGVSEWKFDIGVAGFGFLSLAVMIFGQWKPHKIALAALLFGFFRALSNVYTGFDFLVNLNIPSTVYNMLPYIISLIILAFTSNNSKAPKAEGIPYDKGSR
ncbi:MAG: ABC transporter permease [Firmicutes bacterium]|nr:ABC transporter permease [Bacillota bacterium]